MPAAEPTGAPDAHPDKPLSYSSPLILERRRRLLHEARLMIAEGGMENLSVRQLCQRAGVAQRTLYNAFHNKDRVIALAIREAYDAFSRNVRHQTDELSLAGVLDRTIAINRRNLKVKNYTKAVASIYFSPNTPRDIWETLRDMSNATQAYLAVVEERGELNDWVDQQHFATIMANVQYAVINDWCLDRLTDEEYLPRLVESMLLLLIGALRGNEREEAERFLLEIKRTSNVPVFPNIVWSPPRADPKKEAATRPAKDE